MSAAHNMSRKRPAPGASPIGYPPAPQNMQSAYQAPGPPLTDDQFFNWGASSQDPSSYANPQLYNTSQNQHPSQPVAQSNQSNQLTRRPPMNQMVPRPQQNNQWGAEREAITPAQQQEPPTTWSDDINELVAKAQVAKREAQSKRKQIPPFVLKLHR